MKPIIFVTGTDTGVGKTEFTAAFTRWLRSRGVPALALKPLASGGRQDAVLLEAAQGGALPLDWVNPWHFREPLAPKLAARLDGRRVALGALLEHVRATARLGAPVLVEGAGGLLSPLLEDADAPEVIRSLVARPVVVAPNRLGVVNQVRLVWEALPAASRRWAQVVLVDPARRDSSVETNRLLLAEYLDPGRIHRLPRWKKAADRHRLPGQCGEELEALARGLGLKAGNPG